MPSRPESLEWLLQAGVPTMRWSPTRDHRELDELFERWNTDVVLLGWKSRVPPARSRMSGGLVQGLFGAYAVRESLDWPDEILEAARRFGAFALDRGHGHTSLDFTGNPEGRFEAIEVNLGNVALWWTSQFPSFRRRFARGVHRMLVEKHRAPATLAPVTVRLRNILSWGLMKPKLVGREIQAALFRRRYSDELVSRHAASRLLEEPE